MAYLEVGGQNGEEQEEDAQREVGDLRVGVQRVGAEGEHQVLFDGAHKHVACLEDAARVLQQVQQQLQGQDLGAQGSGRATVAVAQHPTGPGSKGAHISKGNGTGEGRQGEGNGRRGTGRATGNGRRGTGEGDGRRGTGKGNVRGERARGAGSGGRAKADGRTVRTGSASSSGGRMRGRSSRRRAAEAGQRRAPF